jgi:hypothetical protein
MSIFFQSPSMRDMTRPERVEAENRAIQEYDSKTRKETQEQLSPWIKEPSWYSGFLFSASTEIGVGLALKAGYDVFGNDQFYNTPLNFEPKRERTDFYTYQGDVGKQFDHDPDYGRNNLEGILELTADIPDEDRRFILNSKSWGEFQDRLTYYRMQGSMAVEEAAANYGGTAPIWAAFGQDAASIVAAGYATEPLAWLGTAGRLKKAGEASAAAAAAGAGGSRVAAASALAANLAKTAPVINLAERAGRYAALGVIDQTIYNMARMGANDFYRPETEQIAIEYAAALSLGGVVGGTLSKRFANDLLRGYAESAFSTLPVTPVSAATRTVSAAGPISTGIQTGPSRITSVQAGSLVAHLQSIGVRPGELLAELQASGLVTSRSLGDIPNDPVVLNEVNRIVRDLEVSKGASGPFFRLRPEGTLGDSGAATVAKRAEEVASILDPAMANKGEAVTKMAANLLADMRSAGYKVRRLSEIPNDPDTLAKIDAWFDDIAEGYNSPFGFRRKPVDEPSQYGYSNIRRQGGTPGAQPTPVAPRAVANQSPNAAPSTTAQNPSIQTFNGPRNLGKGAASQLPGAVPPNANPLEALEAAIPVNNIRIPWLNRFLNQAAFLLERGRNPHARHFAFRAFFARRLLIDDATGAPVPQQWTVSERIKNTLDTVLAFQIRSHDAHFQRFALGMNLTDDLSKVGAGFRSGVARAFGAGRAAARTEFDNRVWTVLTTGAPDPNDVVNSFAAEMRQMMDELAEYARVEGVPGFEMHRMLQNYFPRLYNFDRIQRITATAQGRAALTRLLEVALEVNPGSRELRLWNPNTGVYDIFQFNDIGLAAQAFMNRLMELSVGGENAAFLDLDQALVDAIENMQGALRDNAVSPSPRGRPRILLNDNAEIDAGFDVFGTGTTMLRLGDIVNRDMVNVTKKYATSVLGATAERQVLNIMEEDLWQLGFRSIEVGGAGPQRLTFETLEDWVRFANREGQLRYNGRALTPEEEIAVDRIRTTLRFQPRIDTQAGRTGGLITRGANIAAAGVSTAKAYTFMLFGGFFAAAALAETGRVMGTFWPIQVIREMPIALTMLREWNNLSVQNQGIISLLDQFGIATDRLRRTIYSTPEAEIAFSRRNRFVRGLGDVSNTYSDVTGLGPVTSFTQFLTGITLLQHLLEAGRGQVRQMDEATILNLGLSRAEYEAAQRFLNANAVTARRGMRDAIIDINNVNDPEFDIVLRMMDRMVKTRIQDVATVADTSSYADSALGSLMTQFKNYNIKAVDNLLLQNYSRIFNAPNSRQRAASGARVASEIIGAFLIAGLIKQAKTIMDAKEAEESGDLEAYFKIRENIGLQGFLKQGLMGPGEFWIPTVGVETVWSQFNDEPLLSQFRYSGGDLLSFPALETAKRAAGVARDVSGAVWGNYFPGSEPDRFVTRKTTDNLFKLIPGQNFPPVSFPLAKLQEFLNDEYDLPYEQPRR